MHKNKLNFSSPPRCINIVRSVAVNDLECSSAAVQQLNQITHWLDNSNVYGSLEVIGKSIFQFKISPLDGDCLKI